MKITMLLLAMLFVSGCERSVERKQNQDSKDLHMVVVRKTATNVVFKWTSTQPVQNVELECDRGPQDPNIPTGWVAEVSTGGGVVGLVSLGLLPGQKLKCNLHSTGQPLLVSNTIQVQ